MLWQRELHVEIIDGRKTDSFEQSTKVLVDIFRSTSTMPVLVYKGAREILPAASIREARGLKKKFPDSILVGERYGFKVPGFELNNSPEDALGADVKGKTVIFTSTNGTKVLRKIAGTGKIYISSFINATATLEKLKGLDRVDIVVSARPDGPADEDLIFAEYFKDLLLDLSPDFDAYAAKIRTSNGAKRLRLLGAGKDIEASLKKDLFKKPLVFRDNSIVIEE